MTTPKASKARHSLVGSGFDSREFFQQLVDVRQNIQGLCRVFLEVLLNCQSLQDCAIHADCVGVGDHRSLLHKINDEVVGLVKAEKGHWADSHRRSISKASISVELIIRRSKEVFELALLELMEDFLHA